MRRKIIFFSLLFISFFAHTQEFTFKAKHFNACNELIVIKPLNTFNSNELLSIYSQLTDNLTILSTAFSISNKNQKDLVDGDYYLETIEGEKGEVSWVIKIYGEKSQKYYYTIPLFEKNINGEFDKDEVSLRMKSVFILINFHFNLNKKNDKAEKINYYVNSINHENNKVLGGSRVYFPKYLVDSKSTPSKIKQAFDARIIDYVSNSVELYAKAESDKEKEFVFNSIPISLNKSGVGEVFNYIKMTYNINRNQIIYLTQIGEKTSQSEKIYYTDF